MKRILTLFLWLILAHSSAVYAESEDPDVIEFAMITDTHRYGPSADVRFADSNIQAFIDYCNNMKNLSFAIHGGDFMNAYNTNHEQALWCLNHARRDFENLKLPFYVTKGNHDCNGKQRTIDRRPDNSQIVTDHEFFGLFSPVSPTNPLAAPDGIVTDPENPEGNYYYKDFPKQRFRLIMLNAYDRDSLEIQDYHGQQVKWLAETALNFEDKPADEEWSFLIVGHTFSVNMVEHPTSRLMHAYVHGQPFTDTNDGITYGARYDKMKRGTMIGILGGHVHEDVFRWHQNYNMISMTRGFATGGEVGNFNEEVCFSHFKLNTRTHTLEERRIGRGRSRMFTYGKEHNMTDPAGTFPEADGMGGYTHGGANGKIYVVTNLNDSGEGSLRWAIAQEGCREIMFNVSGTIKLKSPLEIINDSISIIGHSAPGQGITLTGAPVRILASEVIMRYLRVRGEGIYDGDFGQHHLMLDHLSVSCTQGSCISIRRAKEVSVQNCILSHPLLTPAPADGHQPAALIAGGFMATYHHNLIANAANAVMFPNNEGENRWVHFVRNIISNWRDHAMFGGEKKGEITIEENYLLPGAATVNNQMLDVADDGTGRYYLWGNEMKGREEFSSWNSQMVNDRVGLPYDPDTFDVELRMRMDPVQSPSTVGSFANTCLVIAAFHYKPFFDSPSKINMFRESMLIAGCSRERDEYDNRLIASVRNGSIYGGTDGLISSTKTLGDVFDIPTSAHTLPDSGITDWLNERSAKDKSIVIFYDNEPLCNIAGYPKLAGTRDAISPDTAHVAMVSCGDYLDGGLIGYMSKGRYVVSIMKYAEYDAVTLGNHEFNMNIDTLRNILSPIQDIVTCSNLVYAGTHNPVYKPYVMRQYGRKKVAFIGVTTPQTIKSRAVSFLDADKHQIYDLLYDDVFYRSVQENVDKARSEGADYVIILSHLGQGDTYTTVSAEKLVSRTHGINAVLDSHRVNSKGVESSYLWPNAKGDSIRISWAADQFNNIGKMVIAPDGIITNEFIALQDQHFNNTPTMLMLDSIQSLYEAHITEKIGYTDVEISLTDPETGLNIRNRETNAGDLVADALRTIGNTDVSIINSGSIRAGLDGRKDILRSDILMMLPFDNNSVVVSIKGEKLKLLLDAMAKRMPSVYSGHLIQQAGLRYDIHQGDSVSNVEVLDKRSGRFFPLKPDATYTVATIDFCLYENIYREAFSEAELISVNEVYAETLIEYIRKYLNGHIKEEYALPKKRFRVLE